MHKQRKEKQLESRTCFWKCYKGITEIASGSFPSTVLWQWTFPSWSFNGLLDEAGCGLIKEIDEKSRWVVWGPNEPRVDCDFQQQMWTGWQTELGFGGRVLDSLSELPDDPLCKNNGDLCCKSSFPFAYFSEKIWKSHAFISALATVAVSFLRPTLWHYMIHYIMNKCTLKQGGKPCQQSLGQTWNF